MCEKVPWKCTRQAVGGTGAGSGALGPGGMVGGCETRTRAGSGALVDPESCSGAREEPCATPAVGAAELDCGSDDGLRAVDGDALVPEETVLSSQEAVMVSVLMGRVATGASSPGTGEAQCQLVGQQLRCQCPCMQGHITVSSRVSVLRILQGMAPAQWQGP